MSNPFKDLTEDAKSARILDYVKGRLDEDDRAAVEAAALEDPVIAEELAYYQGLGRAGHAAPEPQDHEFGWSRLSKAIDEDTQSSAPPLAANDNSQLWRVAAFGLGLLALVQAGLLFDTWSGPGREEPVYIPVTEESGFDLQVIFANDATNADIRDLLIGLDGEIVAGPSAIGLYDVRFTSDDDRRAGLEGLRAASNLVESVNNK
ncbi:MAG: hypothetical protein AAGJ29_09015 [Pseudomonadota bacterium]